MVTEVAYRLFCGACLRDEEHTLFAHLRANEDCSEQLEAWDYTAGAVERLREQDLVPKLVMWVIIATVPLSSLAIVQQVLLDVLASGICTTPSLAGHRRPPNPVTA
jgi:hypothetical protein